MRIARRKFLRLAPASVGAIALGAAVLPKIMPAKRKVTEAMLLAGQKATDPPLTTDLDGAGVNLLPGKIVYIDGEIGYSVVRSVRRA